MTAPKGKDLRNLLPEDSISMPQVLNGHGFVLQPSSVKIFKPTGAPAYFYDVMTDDSTRIGVANLIVETDPQQVSEMGHVCARLLEKQHNAELLKQVAELLISHGSQLGLSKIRIVVPEHSKDSVQVCEAIDAMCERKYLERDGEKFAWFEYSTNSANA